MPDLGKPIILNWRSQDGSPVIFQPLTMELRGGRGIGSRLLSSSRTAASDDDDDCARLADCSCRCGGGSTPLPPPEGTLSGTAE